MGIAVAAPTLCTWIYAVEKDKEQAYLQHRSSVLEIVKHYDEQSRASIENIKVGITPVEVANMKYILSSFEKFYEDYNKGELNNYKELISLNFPGFLSSIYANSKIDNLQMENFWNDENYLRENDEFNVWYDSTGECVNQIVNKLIETKDYRNLNQKFYYRVKFKENINNLSLKNEANRSHIFKGVFFIECEFNNIDVNKTEIFNSCKFINCLFHIDDQHAANKFGDDILKTLSQSSLSNIFYQCRISDKNQTIPLDGCSTDNYIDNRGDVISNVKFTDYLLNGKFWDTEVEDNCFDSYKNKIIQQIIDEQAFENIQNSKIRFSKSKNYNEDPTSNYYDEMFEWTGWHSIFKENLDKKYFDLFVFYVVDQSIYHSVIFTKEDFWKYIGQKTIAHDGKYHFYFSKKKETTCRLNKDK